MIRRGKAEQWLTTPPDSFQAWVRLNDVTFHDLKVDQLPGKGAALLASKTIANSEHGAECLMTVPKELILSLETARGHALIDQDFKEMLESAGDFGRTARGAILLFLLSQISTACRFQMPGEKKSLSSLFVPFGVHSAFTHYVKTLPAESLPTTWTQDELALLTGTTLAAATTFKLRSLRKEYDTMCALAANTRWWSLYGDVVEFDDWIAIDAMYRSRALEYPGIGHCMVPCVDIANHASGDATVAVYDQDQEGNAVLLLRDGKVLSADEEVTISYGDEKGACEMIFSYGFLERGNEKAEALFLDLSPTPDDRFGVEKRRFADCAPGFKIIDAGDGKIDWTGDFIWLLCLFPDDGLHFDIAQMNDGQQEVQAFFGEHELKDGAAGLRRILAQSELWDVWRLRAISILQMRVGEQLDSLVQTQDQVEATAHGAGSNIDSARFDLISKLRVLEFELLNQAYEDFTEQIQNLAQSTVVVHYLEAQQSEDLNGSEDFS